MYTCMQKRGFSAGRLRSQYMMSHSSQHISHAGRGSHSVQQSTTSSVGQQQSLVCNVTGLPSQCFMAFHGSCAAAASSSHWFMHYRGLSMPTILGVPVLSLEHAKKLCKYFSRDEPMLCHH